MKTAVLSVGLALALAACTPDGKLPSDPAGGTATINPANPGTQQPPDPRPSVDSLGPTPGCPSRAAKAVLVDASHDGGVWWFPQVAPFSESAPHQGQGLAGYLRDRGFAVRELARGAALSADSLLAYPVVIRAGKYGPYSAGDFAAYRAFVACPRTLLLIGEFLRPGQRDELADSLGIPLTGWINGTVDSFAAHPITAGMGPLPYIAGSTLEAVHDSSITVLGWAGGSAVMGVRNGLPARIFFLGDLNGIELVPQPLVSNLIAWGF